MYHDGEMSKKRREKLRQEAVAPGASTLALGFFVAAAAALVFLPSLKNGFVNWDDDFNILNNPDFRGLGWKQLRWMFTTFHLGPYQPLSWLTLGFDFVLWGLDPKGYHLTNTLLHSANAGLFFALSLDILRRIAPAEPRAWRLPAAAAFSALVFAIHPLRVESVAWVTERRDVLSGLFYLLAVLSYLRGQGGRWTRHAWTMGFFAAALLSKAIVITLPAALIALDFYPLRRIPLEPRRWFEPEAREAWLEKIPYLLLALALASIGLFGQKQAGTALSLKDWGIMPRVSQAVYGLAFYIQKTLLPMNLFALYECPKPIVLWSWPYWGCAALAGAITAAAIALWRSWPAGLLLWACYVAGLLPVLGLVRLGQAATADRYTYLSCLGWALLAGAGLERALRGPGAYAALALAALLCAGLARSSVRQVAVWRDSISLWTHALAINPRHIYAANNLGNALSEVGRDDEAIAQYETAVRNNPAHPYAYYNLGNALSKKGLRDKAEAAYREALRWNLDYPQAQNNLAALLCSRGNFAEAEPHFRAALRWAPDTAQTHFGLAGALRELGRPAEALEEYAAALRLDPGLADAHNERGITLARLGRNAEAAESFRAAARAQPGHLGAHVNLALVLTELRGWKEAEAEYRAAVGIDPRFPARATLEDLLRKGGVRP
jgi:tetratricopeptide (TPR) repeat protein